MTTSNLGKGSRLGGARKPLKGLQEHVPIALISELLERPERAKIDTKVELCGAYHLIRIRIRIRRRETKQTREEMITRVGMMTGALDLRAEDLPSINQRLPR